MKTLYYVKVGFQEPTKIVVIKEVLGTLWITRVLNFNHVLSSEIVEICKGFQQRAKNKQSIAFTADSDTFRSYLSENGIENVIRVNEEIEQRVLKYFTNYIK